MSARSGNRFGQSLSGSSPLCVKVISNTKKISGGYVKHNNLLWCRVSKRGLHVSALFYKAIFIAHYVFRFCLTL